MRGRGAGQRGHARSDARGHGVLEDQHAAAAAGPDQPEREVVSAAGKPRIALELRRENGRKVTAEASGHQVALIFWRKNDGVLLPLVLDTDEAAGLAVMLQAAVVEANEKLKQAARAAVARKKP